MNPKQLNLMQIQTNIRENKKANIICAIAVGQTSDQTKGAH